MHKVHLVLDQHQAQHLSPMPITHRELSRNPRNSWKWCILCTEHLRTLFFSLFIWFTEPPSALHSFRGRLQKTNYKIYNITNSWVVRSELGSSWITLQPPGFSFLLLLPEFWPFRYWLAHSLEGGEPRERRFYLSTALIISLRKNKVYKTNIKF